MNLEDELRDIIEQMKVQSRVAFENGLSDDEINSIEQRCNFLFPPDLKTFLQLGVPVGGKDGNTIALDQRFPNWRKDPMEIMQKAGEWKDGFYFDIKHHDIWMTEWGEKPHKLTEQLSIAKAYLHTVPLLIPIFQNEMIPVEPCLVGNPVFYVRQTINTKYYGYNLQNYLRNQFTRGKWDRGQDSDYRYIPFWSKLAAGKFP